LLEAAVADVTELRLSAGGRGLRPSVDAVAPALHAGGESTIKVIPLLGELRIVLLLAGGLLLLLIATPHCSRKRADPGPGRGSPAGIAGDGTAHGTECGAPGSTSHRAALWRRDGLRCGVCGWIGRIEARLLNRPDVAFTPVGVLLLRTLPPGRVEEHLLRGHRQRGQQRKTSDDRSRRLHLKTS
jgi:hypothetical protein